MTQIHLVITRTDNGDVKVEGAIGDMVVALGLLEVAKVTIANFHADRKKSGLVLVPPGTTVPPVKPS